MSNAYTDYPRQGRFGHMAPIMGAVPIFGPRHGQGFPVRGLGFALPTDQNDVADPTAPPSPETTIPATVTDPQSPSAELAVGAGTAALAGAVVGGVAAGSYRGAGIGAGVNVGVWSALTAMGHWNQLSPGSRLMLTGAAGVGLVTAITLVVTRKKTP